MMIVRVHAHPVPEDDRIMVTIRNPIDPSDGGTYYWTAAQARAIAVRLAEWDTHRILDPGPVYVPPPAPQRAHA